VTEPNPSSPELRRRRIARVVFLGLVLASAWAIGYLLPIPFVSVLAKLVFWLLVFVVACWLLWRAYQRLLWHVGGRLAFSYFLIGVVPIPLALALVLIVGYGLTGFYLSRAFHDAVSGVQRELTLAAASGPGTAAGRAPLSPIAFARFRDDRKVEGDPRAPEAWPGWLVEAAPEPAPPEVAGAPDPTPAAPEEEPEAGQPWLVLPDGTLTLGAASPAADAAAGGAGTLAFYDGEVEALLRERAGIWIEVGESTRSHAVRVRGVQIQVGATELDSSEQEAEEAEREAAQEAGEEVAGEDAAALERDRQAERHDYFAERAEGLGWTDRPLFTWGAVSPRPVRLDTGERLEREMGVLLQATPRMVARSLFSTQTELLQGFWVALLVSSLLLLAIYAVAELVAIAMIVGISRAVSRLYAATRRVAAGDFSARIPVRRRDQVGAVQRSFNSMAENLEDLVSTVAQKELLDKELQIARQVQQSLIPQNLPASESLEFSTLFEPSAAIGGDYFDVLRLGEGELAVVVADVSGHGLPTGLRMAMVKAALGILVVETHEADEILRRLDATVRSGDGAGDESRFFVTAVFSRVDFRHGVVEITNAGHPPVYLLRGGAVEEILLPGSPLGGLGHDYGRRRVELADGDVLIWLSDGLIEASDGDDEPFGYDRIEATLAGPGDSAVQVRDRLLAAVEAHTEGRPAMDDRTLVVMRYSTP
jgi:serine phosphatase RsbU (regulator of sigma subunit)